MKLPFFVTIPHSGERVPEDCSWLRSLPETTLMCDVDRFVDQLYEPTLRALAVPWVKTEWHRYAADLNRVPADVDASSVQGDSTPAGTHSRGFHWVMTTTETVLMPSPMSRDLHHKLVQLIYEPFHQSVRNHYEEFKKQGATAVYHLDLHSMPGLGTNQHRDPGQLRADIVVSDCQGQSARSEFVDLVLTSYARAGFKVGYNWPYFGGRVSEQYGQPARGQHTVQVELNRSLYMNEESKALNRDLFSQTQKKLAKALEFVHAGLVRFN